MRILVAEDDSRLLKSLVHIFEANHYVTDAVNNGQDAYAISNEYDGLILDIMMPGMDGITLLKKLRGNGIPPRTLPHRKDGDTSENYYFKKRVCSLQAVGRVI